MISSSSTEWRFLSFTVESKGHKNESKVCTNVLQVLDLYSNICFVLGLEFLVVVSHGDGSGNYSMRNVLYSPLQNPATANGDSLPVH